MRFVTMAGAVAAFCGCASSSGILPMGPDTYTVSVGVTGTGSMSGNSVQATQKAFSQANAYCEQQGRKFLFKHTNLSQGVTGSTYELVFYCLKPDDPALVRPDVR